MRLRSKRMMMRRRSRKNNRRREKKAVKWATLSHPSHGAFCVWLWCPFLGRGLLYIIK